jgi:hypothetical protein
VIEKPCQQHLSSNWAAMASNQDHQTLQSTVRSDNNRELELGSISLSDPNGRKKKEQKNIQAILAAGHQLSSGCSLEASTS